MADETNENVQERYPYATEEFFQTLTDLIVRWVYENFVPKRELEQQKKNWNS